MAPFSDELLFMEMANKVHNAHLIRKIVLTYITIMGFVMLSFQ